MVDTEFAIVLMVTFLGMGFGLGLIVAVGTGLFAAVYDFAKGRARQFAEHEAAMDRHSAELEARNKAGCRRTTGKI